MQRSYVLGYTLQFLSEDFYQSIFVKGTAFLLRLTSVGQMSHVCGIENMSW